MGGFGGEQTPFVSSAPAVSASFDTPFIQPTQSLGFLPSMGIKLNSGGYACPFIPCSKKFRDKTDLTRHIRTHTGESPYACPQCSYRCKQKGSLKIHMIKCKHGLDNKAFFVT